MTAPLHAVTIGRVTYQGTASDLRAKGITPPCCDARPVITVDNRPMCRECYAKMEFDE